MAKIASPAIPHKMYRNFAIITLAATALMALVVDSEPRDAISAEYAEREREAELQRISAEKTRPKTMRRRELTQRSRFGGGDTAEFGAPTVRMGGRSSAAASQLPPVGATRSGETLVIPGYSRAYLDSLSEAQYRQLVANLAASGTFNEELRESNLAAIERISSGRSGQATTTNGLVQ